MPRCSLTRLALTAVAQRSGSLADASSPELVYLASQAQDLPSETEPLVRLAREALRKPVSEDVPLARLANAWQLSLAETLSIALVAVVERDLLAGRALAFVQAPVGGSRPTLGLLAEAFAPFDGERRLSPLHVANWPSFASGTLQLLNDGAAMPERPVSLPLPLCLALNDEEVAWPGGIIDRGNTHVPLPESVQAGCRRHASALVREGAPVLVMRSAAAEEIRAAAALIADALGKRTFVAENVNAGGLAAWLLLRDLLPVFVCEPAPGETKAVPPIPQYSGPIIVATGVEGTVECPGREVAHWALPRPNATERERLWKRALPHAADAAELAATHRLGAARIAQLGRLATHEAHLAGRGAADGRLASVVSRRGEGAGLDTLAQLMPESISDEALVLSAELRGQLEALLARCRHRDGLTAGLGAAASARYTAGVRALFVGPSGTGKTLAAGWLATRLGLPLYRVDLASINSKYIGETEKNLARLLARAEHTEAILLFDEADSLFGKRTEIRDSNDRFANTQTNYLLQRIETFDSIAILTSNSRGRFDTAFSRRLDVIIEFPAPAPAERRALWQAHLGDAHSLSMQEMNLIAGQCDFAGGQIRNVVLAAAVAARDNGQVIDYGKLLHALHAEYRKAGRPLPPALASARATAVKPPG